MPSTKPLLERIQADFPTITFHEADEFRWQPSTQTVSYLVSDTDFDAHLLHEVSHAILKHSTYERDIDLIAMERDAWAHARIFLAPLYDVAVSGETIHTAMDSYRDWLHARSTCPNCSATGLQMKKDRYRCVSCRHEWRVNDARVCALRRYNES